MQSVPTGIPAARSDRRPIEGRGVRGGCDRGSSRRPVLEAVAGPPADPSDPPGRPPSRRPADPARDEERGLATKQRPKADRPPRFKVLLFNDDYTPMEFVVQVLEQLFGKSPSAATQIMLQIHRSGIGVAGVYVLEVAETKSTMVHRMAEERGYPLRSGVEKE
ncbi:MAG: ATP-dependent Clp protease adaptor ClpS [Deltaproteobacteria bacterium]|nr:ATP-dependent Clp protease adaptor ClpS [Deltaproteobacteria bacterium]